MVHERGTSRRRRWRRRKQRKRRWRHGKKVEAQTNGQTVPVETQKRARIPIADQQARGARHGIFHVRGCQRNRENTIDRHTRGQNQPFQ